MMLHSAGIACGDAIVSVIALLHGREPTSSIRDKLFLLGAESSILFALLHPVAIPMRLQIFPLSEKIVYDPNGFFIDFQKQFPSAKIETRADLHNYLVNAITLHDAVDCIKLRMLLG